MPDINGGMRTPEHALPASIIELNKNLADWYGTELHTGHPIFRIVWANNETEIRHGTWQDYIGDVFLREVTETRKVLKYDMPYWKDKYILERLILVPDINKEELPTAKLSYEPLWTFENVKDEPVPPTVEGTRFIIDTVLAQEKKAKLYKAKPATTQEELEKRQAKINRTIEELFGDESDIADALHLRSAVVKPDGYPSN